MKRYKKNLLAAATFLFCSLSLSAQSADHNYVKQETMLNASKSQKITSVQYYDGYSRPVLQAGNGTAGNGKYTFALTTYDNVGRVSESWLPAVGTTSSDFIAASEVQSLSDTTYGDSYAYTRNHYDALGRTTSVDGIGSAWRSAGKKVTTAYGTNTWNEVRKYTATSGSTTLSSSAYYSSGTLSVETVTDEDGKTHAVYKDATGKTILERSAGNHDTYYVYDDMDRLRFVLPPCANDALSSNGSWSMDSNDVLRDYAYYYEYDGRGRCVKKKLPGAEPVLQEYDNRNRMTFSQDGNQRTNSQWTYYLYDGLDRLTEQGVCPDKSLTSKNVHIVNHYDGYDFVGTGMFAAPEFEAGSVSGKGLLTGSVAYGLNVAGPVRTVFHYDNKGRVVKETASNGLNGFDTRVTTYSFTDKPLTVTHTHTASGKEGLTEVYTYTYDHADRLSSVKHRLNDGTEVVLANYTYDDLGRIQAKKLHNSTHTTSYAYNVRGWTTGITNGNFTQSLTYNNGTAGFNGNITAMTWTAGGSSHNYAFTYDGLNRMLNATHDTNAYTEKVTGYDKNGNITGLQRYGNGLIDNLTYTYNGNRLTKVEDATGNATGFTDGASQANEYTYDNNGNLTQDLNKGITNISYNFLNLPQQIRYSNGVVVNYGYSADGVKQRVQHLNSGLPNVVYCGNVIYEGDVAKLLLTEEGYIDLANGNAYYYYLKDHQGNNRVVINGSGTVMETNHYYPFGGVFSTSNVQPYKYNGKELDTKNGLNWYDYGARHYDAALGRWFVVDPLAEKYYSISPYVYCNNNSIGAIDFEGKLIIFINGLALNSSNRGSINYWSLDFVNKVKQQLNDNNIMFRHGGVSINSKTRMKLGVLQAIIDAPEIVKKITGESGNITETIKVISHSMGGSFAKGYIKALLKYFKDNGLTNALVTLEADFDPFQANTLSVIDNVFTQQFTHSRMFEGDYWFLANKKQKGIKEYYNDNNQGSHYITSFFNDISKLREGTYIWNGKEWILKEDEK